MKSYKFIALWALFLFQVKREELLQYAQGAIAGLKIYADIARLLRNICNCLHELGVEYHYFAFLKYVYLRFKM